MPLAKAVAKREEIMVDAFDLISPKTRFTIVGMASMRSMVPMKMNTMKVKIMASINSYSPPRVNKVPILSGIPITQ